MIVAGCSIVWALTKQLFFFFNDTATTEIYTLSLHDALPISSRRGWCRGAWSVTRGRRPCPPSWARPTRSEEHTSELQSQSNLVCRLLLEKKNGWGYGSLGANTLAGRLADLKTSCASEFARRR